MVTLVFILTLFAVYFLVKFIKGAIKGAFLLFDAFFAFSIGAVISHLYISKVIAEGPWAIFFWDLLFSCLAALLYYNLLFLLEKSFC